MNLSNVFDNFFLWHLQKRPEILARNPKAKVTEVVKEIARCWSLMSKEDRLVYKTEAKRGKYLQIALRVICG